MAFNQRMFVCITHLPSGISISLGEPEYRTMFEAREAAIKLLKSKLYMLGYHKQDLKIEYFDCSVKEL